MRGVGNVAARLAAALGIFVLVMLACVIVFPMLGVPYRLRGLGTLLALALAYLWGWRHGA